MTTDHPRIVIGIPTFRRPQMLVELLQSLHTELAVSERARTAGVRVHVADNDSDPRTEELVRTHLPEVPTRVTPVGDPGISAVRNTLVADALADPSVEWLLMVDDDGRVRSPWLDLMIDAAERHHADLLGGPVLFDVADEAPEWSKRTGFASRARYRTGPITSLNGSQNLLLRRSALERLSAPWFDPALGLSGGEDYEFFRRAAAAGMVQAWCDEACVIEHVPAERMTGLAMVRRVFKDNRVSTHIDCCYDGWSHAARRGGHTAYLSVRSLAVGALRRDTARLSDAAFKVVGLAGRVSGLALELTGRRPDLTPRSVHKNP